MDNIEIAQEVRAFMREVIVSYEHLEVLMWLHRAPKVPWKASALETQLALPRPVVQSCLEHLAEHGLLTTAAKAFVYAPATPTLDAAASGLVQAYETHRLDVIRLMSSMALERVRNEAVRMFTDAFVIGGKKKDDV